jgi:deoxyribonuclease-4
MIYTGAPQNTKRRPTDEMLIEEGRILMEENNISPENVVVHAPYIINLANETNHDFGVKFLTEEVQRTAVIGAKQIVLHPGARLKKTPDEAIELIAKGLNAVIENTKELDVKIALETMAGKGTEVGRTFEELAKIIDLVEDKERVSVCFDTCHTHDAGYDTKNDFDGVIEEFDRIVGKEYISVIHVNDSKNVKGAAKDRHENIGLGNIGFEALNHIVNHPDFVNVPKILETPYIPLTEDLTTRDLPPYKEEIKMFKNQKFNDTLLESIREE